MNLQQVVKPGSSVNGFGRRRVDREMGSRLVNKLQSGKLPSNRVATAGNRDREYESPSRDRIVYLTTCLIGHHVEVQVKNGSVFSGIFHATNAEKDFEVVLKLARQIKDASFRGQKANVETVCKAPSNTLIIRSKELVQVIAKDVPVTWYGLSSELHCDKQQELMTDSYISQSRHGDMERELERWIPDEDNPQCAELENIFDGPWNRNWDQFQANETLFGVKSTFNEDLYTTKLEKGPQMRELEKEAIRIAQEIEGEECKDIHLAEERGILDDTSGIDEEARFSAVFRGADDVYDENEDMQSDAHNNETFGSSSHSSISQSSGDSACGKSNVVSHVLSSFFSPDEDQSSHSNTSLESAFVDGKRPQENEQTEPHQGNNYANEHLEAQMVAEGSQPSKSDEQREKIISPGDVSEFAVSSKPQGSLQCGNSWRQPGSSTLFSSECMTAASASGDLGLSPSSSIGSLSSEKSSLNLNAKEFKLNPNAQSFIPSKTSARPLSPVSDVSFYYPTNSSVPHMHSIPIGIGMGPSFSGHQPVVFNPHPAPLHSPQAYYPPNGPQYGQQMIFSHPRQVMYVPNYPGEMPYKGRDY